MSQAIVTMLYRILTQLSTIGTPSNIAGITRVLSISTTTPLAISGVYTSSTIDGINYKVFGGIVTSDVAGTYFLQHSHDGITWQSQTAAATALSAGQVSVLSNLSLLYRYFRIVFTNGAAPQTSFGIGIYLSPL